MLKLTAKQRRFVLELKCGPVGYGSEVRAARAAGYGPTTDGCMRRIAHQVLHHPKVQDALREVGGKLIRAAAFQSIRNTEAIANDLNHRDCLRANLALLDRGFPAETFHTVLVQKTTPETLVIASEEVLRRIGELAARAGLDPATQIEAARAAKQIEAVAEPVAD
jgi:phage terminase small subunit